MIRVLVSPVGLYRDRVMRSIKWLHPEWIFLLVNRGAKSDPWVEVTKRYADQIFDKIKFFYEERAKIIPCDYTDHSTFFLDVITLISETIPEKISEPTEIWVDLTSVPELQEVAILILAALCRNVKVLYTAARTPLLPSKYPEGVEKDQGGVTFEMPIVRSAPLEEIKNTKFEEVLIAIGKKGIKSFADLLEKINWSKEKVHYMRLGRIVEDLEKYGLVESKRINREKQVKLTLGGEMLANYLSKRKTA